jgi:adenylate kinase
VQNKDDLTKEDLIQRVDDNEEIVRDRLSIYHQQTQPLVDYYSEQALEANSGTKFQAISGVGTLDEVKTRINSALES